MEFSLFKITLYKDYLPIKFLEKKIYILHFLMIKHVYRISQNVVH